MSSNSVCNHTRDKQIGAVGNISFDYELVNKLTSVFHASVLLLIMNFVITLSK